MRTTFVSLIVGLGLATQTAAATYTCNLKNHGRYRVIPPEIVVDVAPDGTSATVLDSVIERHAGGPIKAHFFKDTSDMLQVRWRLERVVNSDGQAADLSYNLNFRKSKNRAWVTFRAEGFANTNQGTGTCVLQ